MTIIHAIILGVVEGLTEFLPVSSTAHLMLSARLLQLEQTEFLKSFEIAIQPGAILAVVVLYWRRLLVEWAVMFRVAIAFVPTAVLGLIFYKWIKDYLLEDAFLALVMLAVGGVAIILFEVWHREADYESEELAQTAWWRCALIGCIQALAFVPGVSRSAATILGGLALGLKRKTAVEFSFLLAVPTMAAATAWDVRQTINEGGGEELLANWHLLAIGFVTSFAVALAAIVFLLRFIRTRTFTPFGVYRIVFAVVLFFVLPWRTQ